MPVRPNAPRRRRTADVLSEPKSKTSGDKSFADDLDKERGIVKSRVALLLRSSEIKPFVLQICQTCCFVSYYTSTRGAGLAFFFGHCATDDLRYLEIVLLGVLFYFILFYFTCYLLLAFVPRSSFLIGRLPPKCLSVPLSELSWAPTRNKRQTLGAFFCKNKFPVTCHISTCVFLFCFLMLSHHINELSFVSFQFILFLVYFILCYSH